MIRTSDLRVALFSGNYNYTLDGASITLNRLVGHLLSRGASVRIYSPVSDQPAMPTVGDVVGVPALSIPWRREYKVVHRIGARVARDLARFRPNIVHVSAPDRLGHWAVGFARRHGIPSIGSVHTRFDQYLRYYGMGALQRAVEGAVRRFYGRCDAVVAPSESVASVLRKGGIGRRVGLWPSGVDPAAFSPAARSLEWRRGLGFRDDEPVVGYVGRIVKEKGIGEFCAVVRELSGRGTRISVLVVGDGPSRAAFARELPEAVFVGVRVGAELTRAIASMDILLNPSTTETFGIATLEAMSCGLPVVGADAPGTACLVSDGVTGTLVRPGDVVGLADAVEAYALDRQKSVVAGAAGRREAARYDWDRTNGALVTEYAALIERASPPALFSNETDKNLGGTGRSRAMRASAAGRETRGGSESHGRAADDWSDTPIESRDHTDARPADRGTFPAQFRAPE